MSTQILSNQKHKQATNKYIIFLLIYIYFGNLLSMELKQDFEKDIELKIKKLEQNYDFEIAENYQLDLNHKQINFLKEALIKKNLESLSKLIDKDYLTEKIILYLKELSTTKVSGITQCVISPDFKFAITNQCLFSIINNITLWSINARGANEQTNKLINNNEKFKGQEIKLISISPDNSFAVIESGNKLKNYINLWNLESLSCPTLLSSEISHDKSITSIAISPNCKFVLTAMQNNTACLWDIEKIDQPYQKNVYVHRSNVERICLNNRFVVTSSGSRAFLWDIQTFTPEIRNNFFVRMIDSALYAESAYFTENKLSVLFINSNEIVTSLAISNDNNIIIGYNSGKISSWDISDFTKPTYSYINPKYNDKITHDKKIETIQISDNNLVLVFSEDRISIFDLLSKNILFSKIINRNFEINIKYFGPNAKYSEEHDQDDTEKNSASSKEIITSAQISQNGELISIITNKGFTLYSLFENRFPLASHVTLAQLMLLIKLSKLNTYTNELELEPGSTIFKTLNEVLQDQVQKFKEDLIKKQKSFIYVSPVPNNHNSIILNQNNNSPNNDNKHINVINTDHSKTDIKKESTELERIYEDKLKTIESELKKLKEQIEENRKDSNNDFLKKIKALLNELTSTKEKAFSQKLNTNLSIKQELDNNSVLIKLEEINTKKEKEINDLKQNIREIEEKFRNQTKIEKYLESKDKLNDKNNLRYPMTIDINKLFLNIENNINIKIAKELEKNLLPEQIIILKQKFIKKYKKLLEKLSIFSVKFRQWPIILGNHNHFVNSVALGKNGLALTGGYDYSVKVWNMEDFSKIKQIETDKEIFSCSALAMSPNGNYGLVGSYDGSLRVLDLENQKQLNIKSKFFGHKGLVNCIKFSSNGQYTATCSNDCTILIWKIEDLDKALNNAKPYIIIVCQSPINAIDFSPDNKYILSISNDDLACIWDIEKCAKITQLEDIDGKINTVAFNKNFLALTNSDENIVLWDLKNIDAPIKKSMLMGHTDQVNSAMFNQNGNYIVSCSNDRSIKVWDITNPLIPINLTTFTANTGNILSISLSNSFHSPNDILILTGSDDNFVRLWSYNHNNNSLINLSLPQILLLIKITQLSKYNNELENPENNNIFNSLSDDIQKELRHFLNMILS